MGVRLHPFIVSGRIFFNPNGSPYSTWFKVDGTCFRGSADPQLRSVSRALVTQLRQPTHLRCSAM